MKKFFSLFLVVATVASMVSISACTKTCDTGYEGSDCKTKMNAKFVGTYAVNDTATQGSTHNYYTYSLVITASSTDPKAINLSNFGGFGAGTSVAGTVDGTNFTVSNTSFGAVQVSNGTGTINNNTLSFNYTAYDSTNGTFADHAVGIK